MNIHDDQRQIYFSYSIIALNFVPPAGWICDPWLYHTLRECVEKLQLLNNSEERTRRINEVLEVHVDSHMDPNYESAEEMDDKKAGIYLPEMSMFYVQ